jgi:hypothetical protein
MKINLYHPETGELFRIHHHDVDGWIDNGFLTSPPDLNPIVEDEPEAITPKPKAKKSAPVESE